MWRYLSNLCLVATGILWSFAVIEIFDRGNPGGAAMIIPSLFTAFGGSVCIDNAKDEERKPQG